MEYLEDVFPANPLYPVEAFERAKYREFIQHLELNIELIARRLYAEAFFSRAVSQEIKDEVKAKITMGLTGLARLMKLSPYALGDRFTAADVVAWPHLQMASFATQKIYGQNLVVEYIHGVAAYIKLIESRPYVQKIGEDRMAALAVKLQNK